MKNINEKRVCVKTAVTLTTIALSAAPCFATNFYDVVNPIVDLLNSFLGPILAIVGAVGALYCVLLGVKYARAEEPQDREKAKAHLKGAIIGFVLIFVLIVALNRLLPLLLDWAAGYQTTLKK